MSALAVANEQEILSRTNSLSMLRNLLRMSYCQIAYARGLFPEDCFRRQNVRHPRIDTWHHHASLPLPALVCHLVR